MIRHQYSSAGSHRLVKLDVAGFLLKAGDWVGYNNIATFQDGNKKYMCTTQYFDGVFTPDTLYCYNLAPVGEFAGSENELDVKG